MNYSLGFFVLRPVAVPRIAEWVDEFGELQRTVTIDVRNEVVPVKWAADAPVTIEGGSRG
jgi:hypothetical protein